jgi:hypothetical protein
MRRNRNILTALLLLPLLFQATAAAGADYNLDIKLHIFEQPTCTWAASTQSVVEYYVSQCVVAKADFILTSLLFTEVFRMSRAKTIIHKPAQTGVQR